MDKEKTCMEEKKDWIDIIADNVYAHYDKREIVLWGKYDPVSYTHLTLPTKLEV